MGKQQTSNLMRRWSEMSLKYHFCVYDMQKDLEKMRAKSLPKEIIEERELLVNNLIDIHSDMFILVQDMEKVYRMMNMQVKLNDKVIETIMSRR